MSWPSAEQFKDANPYANQAERDAAEADYPTLIFAGIGLAIGLEIARLREAVLTLADEYRATQ